MSTFSLFKKKDLLSQADQSAIVAAIQSAEKLTSGEIRVYMESRCKYVDALDRARELFYKLKMNETALRNAVLVYIALKDQQLAIFADEGIHTKEEQEFWNRAVQEMLLHFNRQNYGAGIAAVVLKLGEVLKTHFPYDSQTDKNELPDDIVFGR